MFFKVRYEHSSVRSVYQFETFYQRLLHYEPTIKHVHCSIKM